LSLKTKVNLE